MLETIVALAAGFYALDLQRYFSLDVLTAERAALLAWYARHQVSAVAAFVALYVVQTARPCRAG